MKKALGLIFTFLFINLFNFIPVFAAEKSYEIDKVDINAVIIDNGDVEVTEYLTYDFTGNFNGVIRNLNCNGSDGCIVNSISIIDESGLETIAINEDTGSENTYEISEEGYQTSIKVYSESYNEKKILKVNYTIKNAVKKYESTGQLYWNFYSVENVEYIEEANLNISVYNQILTLENSRYETFGDGELSTNYINDGININYKNLSSLIGIDLTIPSEFLENITIIGDSNNINNNDYNIISEQNYEAENGADIGLKIIILLVFCGLVSLIIVLVKNNNKYREAVEKYRSEYDFVSNIEYMEPPSKISPALVNKLMLNNNTSQEILSSTLFYLCNCGYYNMEKYEYTKEGVFSSKIKSDLVFKRNINKNLPREAHLEFIINWFSIYEVDNKFSLINIENDLKNSSKAKGFLEKLKEWQSVVEQDVDLQGIFTIIEKRKTLTNEIYNEKIKWESYKGSVEKSFNLKERLEEFNTADTMLIYARVLGINYKSIENYINELLSSAKRNDNYNIDSFNDMNTINYFNYYLIHMNCMNSIYNHVIPHDSNSNIDSSGGFVGGSSGGDFGGGGGGGSDAF